MTARTVLSIVSLSIIGTLLTGCGPQPGQKVEIDHSNQRLFLVSVHDAAVKKDYAAYGDAIDPDFRSPYKSLLSATRQYVDSLNALSQVVAQKIGPEQAQRFSRLAEKVYTGVCPSPLEGTIRDGKPDWDAVSFLDEGDGTAVVIRPVSIFDHQFVIRQQGPSWYVVPRMKNVPTSHRKSLFAQGLKEDVSQMQRYARLCDNLRKQIAAGKINRENFEERMSVLKATERETPKD